MTGRKAAVGLALLCALAFSAIAAGNASAGQTAFTCVKESGTKGFKDEHCKEPTEVASEVKFVHKEIAPKTATGFVSTNDTTGTTDNAVLTATLGGVAIEIVCTKVESTGTLTNEEVGGVMRNIGKEITILYSGCTVPKPKVTPACEVRDSVAKEAGKIHVTGLKSTTTEKEGKLAVEFSPASGENYVTLEILNCAVKGTYPITGTAVGTASGATLLFEPGDSNLKLGEVAAKLTQVATVRMSGTGGNPISLTKTTP